MLSSSAVVALVCIRAAQRQQQQWLREMEPSTPPLSTALLVCAQGTKTRGEVSGEEEVIYKIEIPANRYDILCLEGLKCIRLRAASIPAAITPSADGPLLRDTAAASGLRSHGPFPRPLAHPPAHRHRPRFCQKTSFQCAPEPA